MKEDIDIGDEDDDGTALKNMNKAHNLTKKMEVITNPLMKTMTIKVVMTIMR